MARRRSHELAMRRYGEIESTNTVPYFSYDGAVLCSSGFINEEADRVAGGAVCAAVIYSWHLSSAITGIPGRRFKLTIRVSTFLESIYPQSSHDIVKWARYLITEDEKLDKFSNVLGFCTGGS
jgi:hypothetical protein